MIKDKWNSAFLVIIMFFAVINILVCVDILPFYVWRICNNICMIINVGFMIKNSNNKDKVKDKKFTIIGFAVLIAWAVPLFIALFKNI